MTEPAKPVAGWVTPVELVRVIDGDTVEIEVTRTMVVRLLDCWAPELRTRDSAERLAGLEAREHMQQLLAGLSLMLSVPYDSNSFDDRFSFGRVLGRIHNGYGDAAELQIAAGHATRTKQKARS